MSIYTTSPIRILTIGRLLMALASLGMFGAIAIAYWLADGLSIGVQIFGHLALPICAGLFKLGYVVRLAAHHALGNINAG